MTETLKSGLGLFAHDFDRPVEGVIVLDEPEVPDVLPPVVSEAMVAQAREEGFREGLAHGRAEAAAARDVALADMTARLVAQMEGAAEGLGAVVQGSGEALAQLVLAAVGRAYPVLCERHGAAEVRRFTHEVVTMLGEEPRIVVRVHPDMVPEVARVVAGLAPERRDAVVVEAQDALVPGDARIGWRHGAAVRDAKGMWARVVDVLGPLGLAPDGGAAPAPETAERHMAPAA